MPVFLLERHVGQGETEGERENLNLAGSMPSAEPEVGFDLTAPGS